MTYAFNVSGASKADALAAVGAEFSTLEEGGAVTQTERAAAILSAEAVVDPFAEPGAGMEIRIGVNGSLSDYGDGIAAMQVGVSVIIAPAEE